jgi:hypothetical protein
MCWVWKPTTPTSKQDFCWGRRFDLPTARSCELSPTPRGASSRTRPVIGTTRNGPDPIGRLRKKSARSDALDESVWAVNPKRDSVGNFASYLCTYAESVFAVTDIRCRLDVDPRLSDGNLDLPARRACAFFRRFGLISRSSAAPRLGGRQQPGIRGKNSRFLKRGQGCDSNRGPYKNNSTLI